MPDCGKHVRDKKMKHWILLAALTFFMGWAHTQSSSQEELARIVEVEGLVTVTTGNQLVSGVVDTRLLRGSRVATATGASTTIEFRSGCRIRIGANETHAIDDEDCCGALFALVPLISAAGAGTAGAAAAGAVAGAAIGTPGLLAATTVGVVGVTAARSDSALSGS
jgi:hypothetical protein